MFIEKLGENFPQYYDVDGVYVKIDYDPVTDEVFGINSDGNPFPPMQAISEGTPITEQDFITASNKITPE